jgi:eukaryotic-like serine/threonine-protein kinase
MSQQDENRINRHMREPDEWQRSRDLLVATSKPSDTVASKPGFTPHEVCALLKVGLGDNFGVAATWPDADASGWPSAPRAVVEFDPETVRGQMLGEYELLGVLGVGGMGIVYRARQLSLNREVALKLIKADDAADLASLRRFRNEAEAVAALDHAHIVPIYEIGLEDSRHYFSMKLIEGNSLDRRLDVYKGRYRDAALLVARVAEAVQHAHLRGILHRDLKPSNILVDDDGQPHVTDFGLARRVSDDPEQSLHGSLIGSPPYMAPEQAKSQRGGPTVATDVYGLGAILYAVLTGHAPHRGSSVFEVLEHVRENPAEPPSKLDSKVPRDLERICLKCLEMEPGHRYATAQAVVDDLGRWLRGEPIEARPVSRITRGWMWCRRKPALAGLSLALAASLIGGMTGIVVSWIDLRKQKNLLAATNVKLEASNAQVTRERDASRGLVDFMTRRMMSNSSVLFGANEQTGSGARTITLESMLDLASEILSLEYPGQPKLEALMRQTLSRTYRGLGKITKAEAELTRCQALLAALPESDEPDRLTALHELAELRLDQHKPEDAEPLARRAYEGRLRLLGPDERETIDSSMTMALVERQLGRFDEAERLMRANLAACVRALPEDDDVRLMATSELAALLLDRHNYAEAEPLFRQELAARTRGGVEDNPLTFRVRNNLAGLLQARRQLKEAEEMIRPAFETARRILGPDHFLSLRSANNLAAILTEENKLAEAADLYREILDIRGEMGVAVSPETLATQSNLAMLLIRLDKPSEAEGLMRAVVDWYEKNRPPENLDRLRAEMNFAGSLVGQGKFAAAEPLLERAFDRLRESVPPSHLQRLACQTTYARVLIENGKSTLAAPLLDELIREQSRVLPSSSWKTAYPQTLLGATLAARGDYEKAQPLLVEGFEVLRSSPDAPPQRVAEALERVIRLYEEWKRPDKAQAYRARSAKLDRSAPPEKANVRP